MAKKITILTVVFLAAILFWVAVEPWIYSSTKFREPGIWILPLLSLIFLSAVVCLSLVLLTERKLKYSVFAASSSPAFVVFGLTEYLLIVLAINFIFHSFAIKRVKNEINGRLKISPVNISRKGLSMIILPLLISVSFAYYLTPSVQESVEKKDLPPSVSNAVNRTINGVLESEIMELPLAQQDKVKNEIVAQVDSFMEEFLGPYYRFMPPILGFGLFLILHGLSYFFIWPAVWLSALLFSLIKKAGFIKIIEHDVKAEVLIL